MTAVANQNIAHDRYLGRFCDLAIGAGVPNLLVIALDNKTAAYLDSKRVANVVRSA